MKTARYLHLWHWSPRDACLCTRALRRAEAGFATLPNTSLEAEAFADRSLPQLHHSRGGQCLWDEALHGLYVGDWAGSVDQKNSLEAPPHPRWDLAKEKAQDRTRSLGSSLETPSALPFLASWRGMLGLTPSCCPWNRKVPGSEYPSNATRYPETKAQSLQKLQWPSAQSWNSRMQPILTLHPPLGPGTAKWQVSDKCFWPGDTWLKESPFQACRVRVCTSVQSPLGVPNSSACSNTSTLLFGLNPPALFECELPCWPAKAGGTGSAIS